MVQVAWWSTIVKAPNAEKKKKSKSSVDGKTIQYTKKNGAAPRAGKQPGNTDTKASRFAPASAR